MSKKGFVGVMVVALVVALTAGALYASNIGFKLNYQLLQTTGGTSKSGQNPTSLPDNRQTGVNTALNLMNDIGFASVQQVSRWLRSSDLFQAYTGRRGSQGDYNLFYPSGENHGVLVKMQTTVNYIIVGSDSPTRTSNLIQTAGALPEGNTSKSGQNFYSYNYHQTAATALNLMNDIGFASVQQVSRWLRSSDLFQAYTGRRGSQGDYALVPGEAYLIKMQTTVSAYSPSHY